LPDRLVSVLRSAKIRQTRERLALGGGDWSYVVCNQAGEPYHPMVLSQRWHLACRAAGVREIKLHAARHTCATLMHLSGVPVVVIAAWIGHKDASLTLKLYAHSQPDALKAAGESLNRAVIG
jgi:integrase